MIDLARLPQGMTLEDLKDETEMERRRRLRNRAKTGLLDFTKLLFPEYQVNWHHREIARFLHRAMTEKGFRGLIVIPPRFGKSELVSVNGPAFYLGQNPTKQVIAVSHTASLAWDFSRQARTKIQDPDWPFGKIRMSEDAKAVGQWEIVSEGTRRRGKYVALGVGGTPTGKGADLLLCDDLVADERHADSAVERESLWKWFRGTALTRLQPGGSALVIGTRWHHDDVIGRILSGEDAGRWEVLHLPAILPGGESLWPEMWPVEELAKKRTEVGERVWISQFQGVPTADEGTALHRDWFPEIDKLPEGILYLLQSWDTAFKVGGSADWSVCGTYAVTVGDMILIDLFRQKLEFPDLDRAAREQYAKFKPREVLIEDKASGQSLIQTLQRETKIPVIGVPVPAGQGKVQRVHAITPTLEARRLKIPAWAPWKETFYTEVTSFPLGVNDDIVDQMTQAVARVYGSPESGEVWSDSYVKFDDPDDDEEYPGWR